MNLITYLKRHLIYNDGATFPLTKSVYKLLKSVQKTNELELTSAARNYSDNYKNHNLFNIFFHIFNNSDSAKEILNKFAIDLPILYQKGYRSLFLEIIKTIYALCNDIPPYVKYFVPFTDQFKDHIRYIEEEIQKMSDKDIIEVMNEFVNSVEEYYPVNNEKYEEEKHKNFMEDFRPLHELLANKEKLLSADDESQRMNLITHLKTHLVNNEGSTPFVTKIVYDFLKTLQRTNQLELIFTTYNYFQIFQKHFLFKIFLHIFNNRESAKQIMDKFFINLPTSYEKGYRNLFLEIIKNVYALYNDIPAYIKTLIPFMNQFINHIIYIEKEIQKMSEKDIIEVMNEFVNSVEEHYPINSEKDKEEEEIFIEEDKNQQESVESQKYEEEKNKILIEENKEQQQQKDDAVEQKSVESPLERLNDEKPETEEYKVWKNHILESMGDSKEHLPADVLDNVLKKGFTTFTTNYNK